MEIKCIKSAARLLDKDCINKGGLDFSKEVLWISVDQRAANLGTVKVGGQKRILRIEPRVGKAGSNPHLENMHLTS